MNQQVLEAKKGIVKEIVEKAEKSESITIADFSGLTVAQI